MRLLLRWTLLMSSLFLITSCSIKPTIEVPETYKAGQKYFHSVCANCHGADALGKSTKAPKLIDVDYIEENFSDEDIRDTAKNGTDKMPPQKANVNDAEITEIIKYLRYSQKTAGLEPEPEEEAESEDAEG
jgi:mono/diheme cytochrome c family protein